MQKLGKSLHEASVKEAVVPTERFTIENKSVAICGSMSFIDDIKKISSELENRGFTVYIPEEQEREISREALGEEAFAKEKGGYIEAHLIKIENSDKVLIANFEKNGIKGYVGPNSLIELAFGYALRKQLLLLYEPAEQPCKPEVLSMGTTILRGNLEKI